MENKIKEQLDQLLTYTIEEDQLDHDAQMLAYQFLAKIDKAMMDKAMSKKDLAEKIGTSPAFITQLFRGDRKPNWNILAKMQKELGLEFKVVTEEEVEDLIGKNIMDYHRNWSKSREYEKRKGLTELPHVIMNIEENKYPLAV